MSTIAEQKLANEVVFDVVETIATREGVDVTELPPLGEIVDVDAFETLLESRGVVAISFEYVGYHVSVGGDGSLVVERR